MNTRLRPTVIEMAAGDTTAALPWMVCRARARRVPPVVQADGGSGSESRLVRRSPARARTRAGDGEGAAPALTRQERPQPIGRGRNKGVAAGPAPAASRASTDKTRNRSGFRSSPRARRRQTGKACPEHTEAAALLFLPTLRRSRIDAAEDSLASGLQPGDHPAPSGGS